MLRINGWGIGFLFLIGFALPWLAIKTSRVMSTRDLPMPRVNFYWQTIFFQLFIYASALVAAAMNGLRLRLLPQQPVRSLAAVVMLIVALAILRLRWPFRSEDSKRRLVRLLPASPEEMPPYFLLCVVAAIAEEVAYRGTGYRLLLAAGLSIYVAAVIMAVAFALGHMVQGWTSVGVIFFFALAFHAVVIYTNALLPAMVVHFAYDAIAGVLVPRWARADAPSE